MSGPKGHSTLRIAAPGLGLPGERPARAATGLMVLAALLGLYGRAAGQSAPSCSCSQNCPPEIVWHDARDTPAGQNPYTPTIYVLQYLQNPSDVPPFMNVLDDPVGDAVIRRVDLGGDGQVDPAAHRLPDLAAYMIGTWNPTEPSIDLFNGVYDPGGFFFRLDLILDGFYNPPGPVDFAAASYLPFLYGDHPVFGLVELDMDANLNTGGELDYPEHRYLGNVCRFGGLPARRPGFAQRAAQSAADFDTNFGPVHRSGEEFHLALFGALIYQIDIIAGNADQIFEPGEVWNLTGELFHRAHGYEPFSLAFGGDEGGVYVPTSWIRVTHLLGDGVTDLALVFPLTNEGAALMQSPDGTPEPLDGNAANQASVLEALDDLAFSADWLNTNPSGDPAQAIIDEWLNQNPADYLDPAAWFSNVELASTYATPPPPEETLSQLVWTDILPEVLPGDFDGDGWVTPADHLQLQNFIDLQDGGPDDDDATDDDVFTIVEFAVNFSIYDVNYDGRVDPADHEAMVALGDIDLDGDVDLSDFATFAFCYGSRIGSLMPGCSVAEFIRSDLDRSGNVDLNDFATFAVVYDG